MCYVPDFSFVYVYLTYYVRYEANNSMCTTLCERKTKQYELRCSSLHYRCASPLTVDTPYTLPIDDTIPPLYKLSVNKEPMRYRL